jgi:hypothetical protein
MARRLLVILGCLLASSCGSDSPARPSPAPRVSGAWIGHSTLTSVNGGECVGSTLASAVGRRDIFSARIQQDESELAASVTYQGNRTSCLYAGSTQNAAVNLNVTSCPAGGVETFVCTNGSVRRLEIVSSRVNAQSNGGTGTGTDVMTMNVFAPGNTSPVGVLTVNAQFIWNVLGIPHDDFHIFDGSILPGYVDGVTIIPEEPSPFCTKCGWF